MEAVSCGSVQLLVHGISYRSWLLSPEYPSIQERAAVRRALTARLLKKGEFISCLAISKYTSSQQTSLKFLTLFSENWQPWTESSEFSADILDRSLVWCHTMGLVFSLPLLYLFVCLIFCNLSVPGWSYPKSCFLWWSTTAKEALRGKNLPSGMECFAKSICSVALASFWLQLFPSAFLSSISHPTDVTDFKSALK